MRPTRALAGASGSWWSVSACSCAAGSRPTTAPPGATPAKAPTRRRAGDLSAATKPEQVATVAASPQAAVHTVEQSRRRTGGVIAGGFAAVTTVGVAPRPARVAPCCDASGARNPGRSR